MVKLVSGKLSRLWKQSKRLLKKKKKTRRRKNKKRSSMFKILANKFKQQFHGSAERIPKKREIGKFGENTGGFVTSIPREDPRVIKTIHKPENSREKFWIPKEEDLVFCEIDFLKITNKLLSIFKSFSSDEQEFLENNDEYAENKLKELLLTFDHNEFKLTTDNNMEDRNKPSRQYIGVNLGCGSITALEDQVAETRTCNKLNYFIELWQNSAELVSGWRKIIRGDWVKFKFTHTKVWMRATTLANILKQSSFRTYSTPLRAMAKHFGVTLVEFFDMLYKKQLTPDNVMYYIANKALVPYSLSYILGHITAFLHTP